ncbi:MULTISPECIES: TetR family transcriptional regulator [Dactylosporangium]|uniref:TetR family transcriptional regulator n=2 Tax=Dactylosporangium TaxID=35753 RepID=A0A9W6KYM1_9ACTN|nr:MULTISPECIES: TetR family transcriptional regulator [Dactylosporangium]UAB94956.1 TetR family transcriptional regulator [Dactylosporangium vinaceum]UWZ43323.1 TetR family transcriptional regulator [Dactylosporangium matsuzakiense]GLL08840.1 TetR family transcriptional regulator [Dactylosporangium matsuzakiense]
MARTGRRPGNQDTREAILTAAREAFAERGFEGASIRQIAAGAGVDPALVHHYFGAKDKLFLATMNAPIDPGEILPQVFEPGLDGVGERLVRTFVSVWDSPAGTPVIALVRSAMQHDWSARMLREFLVSQILRRAIRALDLDPAEAPKRAALVASQMIGLGILRYILKLEPLASMTPEEVVHSIAPTVQRYLAEPLP